VSKEIEAALLKILEKVKLAPNPSSGICYNMDLIYYSDLTVQMHALWKLDRTLERLFDKWPKFSGSGAFPIPDPSKKRNSKTDAYDLAESNRTMWSKHSAYGRLRWELLNFCIDTLKGKQASE